MRKLFNKQTCIFVSHRSTDQGRKKQQQVKKREGWYINIYVLKRTLQHMQFRIDNTCGGKKETDRQSETETDRETSRPNKAGYTATPFCCQIILQAFKVWGHIWAQQTFPLLNGSKRKINFCSSVPSLFDFGSLC